MNKNYFVVIVLVMTAALGFYFYIGLEKDTLPVAPQVVSAPASNNIVEFTLPDLDGNIRHISEWDGKARLINFWATFTVPF